MQLKALFVPLVFVSALFLAGCTPAAQDTTTSVPTATPAQTTPEPETTSEVELDIVETATETEFLSTLTTALEAADLVETLSGPGPFTVFAPTDTAFEALPAGTLDELLADPESLANVLTYHVVEGAYMAADLSDGMTITTVQGQDLEVSIEGDVVMVGDAEVTVADVEASNGYVHVIDTVLVPAAEE
jgi:uncharacterized surface protein with fasciclin (FAS1) repeats